MPLSQKWGRNLPHFLSDSTAQTYTPAIVLVPRSRHRIIAHPFERTNSTNARVVGHVLIRNLIACLTLLCVAQEGPEQAEPQRLNDSLGNNPVSRGDGPPQSASRRLEDPRFAMPVLKTSFTFQDHLWTMRSFGWSLAISSDALEKESQKRHAPSRSSKLPDECANESEATISR